MSHYSDAASEYDLTDLLTSALTFSPTPCANLIKSDLTCVPGIAQCDLEFGSGFVAVVIEEKRRSKS